MIERSCMRLLDSLSDNLKSKIQNRKWWGLLLSLSHSRCMALWFMRKLSPTLTSAGIFNIFKQILTFTGA
jgi:hypothetical protein